MPHKKREGLFNEVYKIVRTIPEGKVTTYGQVARMVGTSDARKIGWALHANKDQSCPCHRVVSKEGGLAANFAFDGPKEQKRRLESEGVGFIDSDHVDMDKFAWEQQQ